MPGFPPSEASHITYQDHVIFFHIVSSLSNDSAETYGLHTNTHSERFKSVALQFFLLRHIYSSVRILVDTVKILTLKLRVIKILIFKFVYLFFVCIYFIG